MGCNAITPPRVDLVRLEQANLPGYTHILSMATWKSFTWQITFPDPIRIMVS